MKNKRHQSTDAAGRLRVHWTLLILIGLLAVPHGTVAQSNVPRQDTAVQNPNTLHPESDSVVRQEDATARLLLVAAVSVAALLFLLVAGSAIYAFVLLPRKRRKPFLQAAEMIMAGDCDEDELNEAEGLLTTALTGGMSRRDIREARFLLAFVRATLRDYPGAAAVLEDLKKTGELDRETNYLDIWVQLRLENYEKVSESFEAGQEGLRDFLQANRIAAIACLHLARRHWRRREIGAAQDYFTRIVGLGELVDEIPPRIDDHQVVLGIMAIFNKRFEEARTQFSGAVKTAEEEKTSGLHGKLGLALCKWCIEETPAMGEELLALVDEARKEHESSAKLKKVSADGKEEKNREANNDDEEATGRLTAAEEKQLLFRNVSLLWAVSMLFEWLQLPERGGLPVRKRKELRERLIAVNKIDKAMPDPLLIAGLIDYYFARNDEERRAAVEELRGALKLGLTVPEVVRLVKAEDKLEVVARDALKLFCNLYRSYLENRTIPLRVRQDLKKKFEKYKAFKSIGEEVDLGEEDDAIQPSIVDIQSREALMRGRLERIVVPRLGRAKAEHAKKVRDQLDGLRECIEALGDHLTKVENTQQEALGSMGEFLLHEEEIPAGDDVKSKKKGRDVFSDIGGALEIEKRKTKATPEDEEEKNND